uniref:GTPase Der n=1 Tax=Albugo laibachii Nc14 TaxID=890382 RepID=F0WLE6_9STRA|nr:ras family GTPase putative [Albugo laibachii Nc14]CCA23399.1 ras family GTPase putative [Albugo laibachii Nc14]|eukprot:CCA23399.1 ras family GTPase putative [Albugo laibachii Nc14]
MLGRHRFIRNNIPSFLQTSELYKVHDHLREFSKVPYLRRRVLAPEARSNQFRLALVGRTNVGKSTLFNRLTKSRRAIVHNVPGTTRDRRFAPGRIAGLEFEVIDTGGLEDAPSGSLEEGMLSQTKIAVHEADLIFFLIDGRQGVTPVDSYFARWLRKENASAPIHAVANKLEGYPDRWQDSLNECYQLGMGEAIPISAEHGEGVSLLLDALIPSYDLFEKRNPVIQQNNEDDNKIDEDSHKIKFAIVGRPNVGKSTLLNRIIREDRVLTGPEPGVTRDSIEVPWTFGEHEIKLIDTAGIRRHSKRDHSNQIEDLSVRDSFDAIDKAQVVAIVTDLSEKKLTHMDLTIAQRVIEQGRSLLIIANKCDMVKTSYEYEMSRVKQQLEDSLAQVRGVSVLPTSALTGHGTRKILPEIINVYEKWIKRISTARLNRWFNAISRHHPPPNTKGKRPNIKYVTQVSTRPPTFVLFVNSPSLIPESYQRFFLSQLREEFGMDGIPARLLLRGNKSENPFQKRRNFQKRTSSVAYSQKKRTIKK